MIPNFVHGMWLATLVDMFSRTMKTAEGVIMSDSISSDYCDS